MATKTTCPDSSDLHHEGSDNLDKERSGSGRSTKDLFSPRRFVGRNDMVVDLNLGKVVIPKEEVDFGVIKEEKMITSVEDEEEGVQVRMVEEDVNISDDFEDAAGSPLLTCSCACWNAIKSLEGKVEEQGLQIQNLNKVVMGLLGKQLVTPVSENDKRPPGNGNEDQALDESRPTKVDANGSGKDYGGVASTNERSVTQVEGLQNRHPKGHAQEGEPQVTPFIQSHLQQPEMPSTKRPGRRSDHSGNAGKQSPRTLQLSQPYPVTPATPDKIRNNQVGTKVNDNGDRRPQDKHGLHKSQSRRDQPSLGLEKKPHKCDRCSKSYRRNADLVSHIKFVHEGVRYQCTHCTGSYAKKRDLVEHEKIHARGIPLIRCELCGLDVVSHAFLRHHRIRFHGGAEAAGAKQPKRKQSGHGKAGAPPTRKKVCVQKTTRDCPECGKGFDCDASLRYHLHKMHGILQMGEGQLSQN